MTKRRERWSYISEIWGWICFIERSLIFFFLSHIYIYRSLKKHASHFFSSVLLLHHVVILKFHDEVDILATRVRFMLLGYRGHGLQQE